MCVLTHSNVVSVVSETRKHFVQLRGQLIKFSAFLFKELYEEPINVIMKYMV